MVRFSEQTSNPRTIRTVSWQRLTILGAWLQAKGDG